MFRIKMQSNAKDVAEVVKKLNKKLTNKTIPNGLDPTMKKATDDFRSKLSEALDQIRERTTIIDPAGLLPDEKASMPKSEKDVLQFLLAKESELEKDRTPSQKNFYNNVHFVQNFRAGGKTLPHLRVTVPAKRTDSMENLYMSAVESFANGIIVYEVAGKNQYFVLSDRGRNAVLDYTKKVCSRYSGVESLDNPETRKRRAAEIKKGINSSSWAIKQEFVEKVVRGQDGFGINITPIIDSLKYGDIDQAETTLTALEGQVPDKIKPAVKKVRKLKENKATVGDESPYVKAAEFSKLVQVQKKIEENKVTYSLAIQETGAEIQSSQQIIKSGETQPTSKTSRLPAQPQAMSNVENWEDVLAKVLSTWLTDKEIAIVVAYTKVLVQDIIEEFEKD